MLTLLPFHFLFLTCYRSKPGSFLYQLLRLELVKRSPTPLSSDAFSFIGRIDVFPFSISFSLFIILVQAPVHNAEVRKAYQHLTETVIPNFAISLDKDPSSMDNMEEFTYKLHSTGINVR